MRDSSGTGTAARHDTHRRTLQAVKPEIHVLGLSIKTFGLFFALNFAAWGLLAARRLKELGRPVDWAYEIVTVALVGGLVGARGYYLLQNHDALEPRRHLRRLRADLVRRR